VTATANLLTVTTGGAQKSFPLNAATKFETLEGTKRRPAKATELKAGQKVHIVAAAEAPNAAQRVEIHIVTPKTPPKTPKETAPRQTSDPKKAKSPVKAFSASTAAGRSMPPALGLSLTRRRTDHGNVLTVGTLGLGPADTMLLASL
jgi:hypothetical protein